MKETHYDVLQVVKTADIALIKVAYKVLAQKHHPDKGGDTELMKRISLAYEILSNSEKRARYDKQLNSHSNEGAFELEIAVSNILKAIILATPHDMTMTYYHWDNQKNHDEFTIWLGGIDADSTNEHFFLNLPYLNRYIREALAVCEAQKISSIAVSNIIAALIRRKKIEYTFAFERNDKSNEFKIWIVAPDIESGGKLESKELCDLVEYIVRAMMI